MNGRDVCGLGLHCDGVLHHLLRMVIDEIRQSMVAMSEKKSRSQYLPVSLHW